MKDFGPHLQRVSPIEADHQASVFDSCFEDGYSAAIQALPMAAMPPYLYTGHAHYWLAGWCRGTEDLHRPVQKRWARAASIIRNRLGVSP